MHYTVDLLNRIIEVGDDWDAAAERAAGASAPLRATIVGRPLEDFMVGDATKMFVRTALEAARLRGETRAWPYRCDTPTERRRYDMVISPEPGGVVRVEHRLISAEPRPPRRALPAPFASAGWRCSQCLAVRLAGTTEWVEDEGHGLLAQDVCPGCLRKLFEPSPSTTEQTHE